MRQQRMRGQNTHHHTYHLSVAVLRRWMALLSERASYILDPTWTDMDPAAATQPQSQTRVPVMPGDDVGRRACSCATHCDAVTSPPPHGDETSVAHAGTPGPSDNATTPADGPARPRPVVQVLHAHRMFVAGDSAALQRASAFVPAGFRLGAISTECRALMNTVLRPFMMTRVCCSQAPERSCHRVLLSGLNLRCQRDTAEMCELQMTNCAHTMVGFFWSDT